MKTKTNPVLLLKGSFLLMNFFFLVACSDQKTGNFDTPEGMHALELNRYGKPFAIFVPDTNRSKLHVEELTNGVLEIRVGDHFGIGISESGSDLSLLKEDLKADEVNKLKEVITDEKNTLVWESAISEPQFHFTTNQLINDRPYTFENLRTGESGNYTKSEIEKMLRSASSTVFVKDKK